MYNQNINKYNVAINRLNREVSKLKQALFDKSKKYKELETKNAKLLHQIEVQKKEIKTLKTSKPETSKESSTKRTYKKKK